MCTRPTDKHISVLNQIAWQISSIENKSFLYQQDEKWTDLLKMEVKIRLQEEGGCRFSY